MKTKKLTLGFLVLGMMLVSLGMVSAAHTSSATISPDTWLKPNTATNFSASVSNTGGTDINRVIIYIPSGYSGLSCGVSPTGWTLVSDPSYCRYTTATNRISNGNSQMFTLTSTTSSNIGDLWLVTTQDTGTDTSDNDVAPTATTIQNMIDDWTIGDSAIEVPAGTYAEDLVINASKTGLELRPETSASVTIKGATLVDDADGYYSDEPNILILANNVKIHGFTLESKASEASKHSVMITLEGANFEVYENDFKVAVGSNANAPSVAIVTYCDDNFCDSNVYNANVDISGLSIHDNTFTSLSGTGSYEAIYLNPDVGTGTATVKDNEFSGKLHRAVATERSNVVIDNNDMSTTLALANSWQGIGLTNWYNDTIANIDITNNDIDGFNRGVKVGSSDTSTNVLSDIVVTNNTIQNSERGIRIYRSANQVTINQNVINNSTVLALDNDDASLVNAENNWWGTANKYSISTLVEGNVDYTPWWYDSTGSSTDTVLPVITFRNTPYSNELGVVTNISFNITDDSGVDSYEIEWGDGNSDGDVDGAESTLVNVASSTHTYGSLPSSGKYTITITANDSVGNVKVATVEVTVYESPDWIIDLSTGANFVTIPFSPKDYDDDGDVDYKDVLERVRPNLDRVWAYTYDETTKKNIWHYRKTTTTGAWSTTGDLQNVVPGYGYIIFMKNNDVLYGNARTVSGESNDEPVTPASVKLASRGYNLIGVFGDVSNISSVLLSKLKSLEGNNYWNGVLDKNENSVTGNLEPNKAYWLSMVDVHDSGLDYYYYSKP